MVKTFHYPRLIPQHLTGSELPNWESSAKSYKVAISAMNPGVKTAATLLQKTLEQIFRVYIHKDSLLRRSQSHPLLNLCYERQRGYVDAAKSCSCGSPKLKMPCFGPSEPLELQVGRPVNSNLGRATFGMAPICLD